MSFSNDSCYNQIQETPTHVQQTKKEIIKLLDEVRVSLILTDIIIWAVPEQVSSTLHTYRINLSPFTKDFRVWGGTYWVKYHFSVGILTVNSILDHLVWRTQRSYMDSIMIWSCFFSSWYSMYVSESDKNFLHVKSVYAKYSWIIITLLIK